MPGKDFPPEHTVDRTVEQDEFHKLLQFNDDARLLAIHDKEGTGKSTLLRRLQYNCQWVINPRIPASLIDLEEAPPTAFALIERIRKGSFKNLPFKTFDDCNLKRLTKDQSVFMAATLRGAVPLQGATISGTGNTFSGMQVSSPQANTMTFNNNGTFPWGDEQEEYAREECINAFFTDLKSIGDQQPCVILLDAYDKCESSLRKWIFDELLWQLCFDVQNRPVRVVIVVAGRELPGFDALGQVRYEKLVRSRECLAKWEEEHVKDFLKAHGYDLDEDDVNYLWGKVSKGKSLADALKLADALQPYSGN